MAVTGTWKDSLTFYSVPTALHVADPVHSHKGHEKGPQEYAWESPSVPASMMPLGTEDFGTKEVIDTRGLEINTELIDHFYGDEWGLNYTRLTDYDVPGGADVDLLQRTHRRHGRDEGASRKQNYSEPVPQFYDERYLSFRIPGAGEETGDVIPTLAYGGPARGLNSLSVNNPPDSSYLGRGFWPGTTEQLVTDRKFRTRIIQRNDERAQSLNLPWFESNAPPPRPGNQSVTPFSALQRMIANVAKIPLQRRTPDLPGDVQAEQATEDYNSPTVEARFYG